MSSKALNPDLILARTKSDSIESIKNLNLWNNDIEDLRLLRKMPNVEVLSLSVNRISSLKEFENCKKLQELYLRKNNINEISETKYLMGLTNLKVLWLWDNPISLLPYYRDYIIKSLPNLVKLDNNTISEEDRLIASKFDLNSVIPKDKERAIPIIPIAKMKSESMMGGKQYQQQFFIKSDFQHQLLNKENINSNYDGKNTESIEYEDQKPLKERELMDKVFIKEES